MNTITLIALFGTIGFSIYYIPSLIKNKFEDNISDFFGTSHRRREPLSAFEIAKLISIFGIAGYSLYVALILIINKM